MHRLPLTPLVARIGALPPSAARYLVRVLRLRVGDEFEAFDPRAGVRAKGAVTSIDRDQVIVAIDQVQPSERDASPLVLVQGHPKGDKLGDIVRDATELGATAIVTALCARSIARPQGDKLVARERRLAAIADEAARQCGRARAPTVLSPMPWDDAVETTKSLAAHGFVLWERATTPLIDDLTALARSTDELARGVAFFVGPEGGLTDDEVSIADRAGFPARSLGSTILRTETAATAVLGAFRVVTARARA